MNNKIDLVKVFELTFSDIRNANSFKKIPTISEISIIATFEENIYLTLNYADCGGQSFLSFNDIYQKIDNETAERLFSLYDNLKPAKWHFTTEEYLIEKFGESIIIKENE